MKNLIRKILKEEFDSENFEWVNEIPELSPAEQFIFDKLMGCELIESKKQPGWTKYVDKNGDFLFLDDIDTGTEKPILYADYVEIWLKCKEMGMNYEGFQKACVKMLYETHKRKVFTATMGDFITYSVLYETHKRKVDTAQEIACSKQFNSCMRPINGKILTN